MKKLVLVVLLISIVLGCSDDNSVNTPKTYFTERIYYPTRSELMVKNADDSRLWHDDSIKYISTLVLEGKEYSLYDLAVTGNLLTTNHKVSRWDSLEFAGWDENHMYSDSSLNAFVEDWYLWSSNPVTEIANSDNTDIEMYILPSMKMQITDRDTSYWLKFQIYHHAN